ncbi:IS21 family transposase [Metallibacterium scheffleri]|nr:IS21 family transposase [Metallibacterium scheffleri]
MRQIREVLGLHFDQGLSQREIARALGVARSTVERVFKRHVAAGLGWPPDPALTDVELERRLYQRAPHPSHVRIQARPDYALVVRELGRKGVTRRLLWNEYRARHAQGIGYSVFCDELAAYAADRDLSYRHDHVPGEKAYFDFAGLTLRYADGDAVRPAQIFVAALGYSNAIHAQGFADQTATSWLQGQHQAFVAFGGVPQIGVPDNPRALIAAPDRYEPRLTAVYADFARHYGITIIPARVRKPKDKASVEGAVKIVEMRILAAARDRIFGSLDQLNAWLAEAVAALNAAPFQKRVGSRQALLAQERPHLAPLPAQRFEVPTYLTRKVARDYHVDVHRQYYSVPYAHVGQTVEVRLTTAHVEVLQRDTRIALHRRAAPTQRFVTDPAHMPAHHQAFRDPKLHRRAAAIGPNTLALIEALFAQRRHPEQAIRSAQGVLALARDHGPAALETACTRALALQAIGYQSVRRLLTTPIVRDAHDAPSSPPRTHEHIRGGDYYDAHGRASAAGGRTPEAPSTPFTLEPHHVA